MTRLRLGPIVEERSSRLTIELQGGLHRMLQDYAVAHQKACGLPAPLPIEKLIPPMLQHFMSSDRGFRRKGHAN